METLRFDATDFTKTIMEAVQTDLNAIQAIEEKKRAISIKLAATEHELKTLQQERYQASKTNDILTDTLEDHEKRMEKLNKIDNRKQVLDSFVSQLKGAADQYNKHIKPCQDSLCKVFRDSVHFYAIKARANIADVIEAILDEDETYHATVFSLYNQIYKEAGVKQPGLTFDFGCFTNNLYPLGSQRGALRTMVNEVREALKYHKKQ